MGLSLLIKRRRIQQLILAPAVGPETYRAQAVYLQIIPAGAPALAVKTADKAHGYGYALVSVPAPASAAGIAARAGNGGRRL